MFRRIIFSACVAGLLAGLVATGLQLFVTVPIILEAESYEGEHSHGAESGAAEQEVASSGDSSGLFQTISAFQNAESDWEPENDLQRNGYTLISNILIAIGFGLLLSAAFSLQRDIRWMTGVLWGLAGYAVFFVLPALGLPPEIPGTFAADLVPRQGWWLLTVVCSGAGLALIVLQPRWAWKISGAVLVIVPHLIGAPHPEVHGGTAPEELANAFIWRTVLVNAVFWLVLGSLTALAFKQLSQKSADKR